MRIYDFLEEKITFILFHISFIFIISVFLIMLSINVYLILIFDCLLILSTFIYLIFCYYLELKKYKYIVNLVDNLEERYFISEILKKPKKLENKAYYYALKKACKSMNDKLGRIEMEKEEYQEYVESFAHEIKTPISVLSLYFDNNKNDDLKDELGKIDSKVEQMLYYARSENTEKDYFVKELRLDEILHHVIMNYKGNILANKISLSTNNLDYIIYTDEKWLIFIISQILQNSIKYLDKKEKKIEFNAKENKNNINLTIIDNGCGIKNEDLSRIFDKCFTGTNRFKEHSTGMGLYLSKKLCDRLNLGLQVESREGKYTKVTLVFPKTNLHKMK